MNVSFDQESIFDGQTLNYEQLLNNPLQIMVIGNDQVGKTVMVYSQQNLACLAVNAGSQQQRQIVECNPPKPQRGTILELNISLYQQQRPIGLIADIDRYHFDPLQWARDHQLRLQRNYRIYIRPPSLRGGANYFKPGANLSETEERWCRCVLHVGKNPKIRNQYAVCSKSVGTSSRNCSTNYDWNNIPNDEIVGYANRHGIEVNPDASKSELIERVTKK